MKLSNSQWQAILLMSFSKRLAAVRKERGLTQQQMSEVIGIHLSQVKRYESGDTQPSLEVLRKIALALNISADMLLFDGQELLFPKILPYDLAFFSQTPIVDNSSNPTRIW